MQTLYEFVHLHCKIWYIKHDPYEPAQWRLRHASFHLFVTSVHSFICVLVSTLASTLNEVYKMSNFILLVSLHWLFYLTELNKDDNSHSSGACFHNLVCRWDINSNKVLYSKTCIRQQFQKGISKLSKYIFVTKNKKTFDTVNFCFLEE